MYNVEVNILEHFVNHDLEDSCPIPEIAIMLQTLSSRYNFSLEWILSWSKA